MLEKTLSKELKNTFEIPEDSIEYLESFLEKIKAEADLIRDALITGSSRASLEKKIDLEFIYDILSVLKNVKLVDKEWSVSNLNDSLLSSNLKLKNYKEKDSSYIEGLQRAFKIIEESKNKVEVIDRLNKEISNKK